VKQAELFHPRCLLAGLDREAFGEPEVMDHHVNSGLTCPKPALLNARTIASIVVINFTPAPLKLTDDPTLAGRLLCQCLQYPHLTTPMLVARH
jgi:hypothetical protein